MAGLIVLLMMILAFAERVMRTDAGWHDFVDIQGLDLGHQACRGGHGRL